MRAHTVTRQARSTAPAARRSEVCARLSGESDRVQFAGGGTRFLGLPPALHAHAARRCASGDYTLEELYENAAFSPSPMQATLVCVPPACPPARW